VLLSAVFPLTFDMIENSCHDDKPKKKNLVCSPMLGQPMSIF